MAEDVEQESPQSSGHVMSPEEKKKQRQRNLVIALSLGGFIVLVFFVTILRLGASIAAG